MRHDRELEEEPFVLNIPEHLQKHFEGLSQEETEEVVFKALDLYKSLHGEAFQTKIPEKNVEDLSQNQGHKAD